MELVEMGNDTGMLAAVKAFQCIDGTHGIKGSIVGSVDCKIEIPIIKKRLDYFQILLCLLQS